MTWTDYGEMCVSDKWRWLKWHVRCSGCRNPLRHKDVFRWDHPYHLSMRQAFCASCA